MITISDRFRYHPLWRISGDRHARQVVSSICPGHGFPATHARYGWLHTHAVMVVIAVGLPGSQHIGMRTAVNGTGVVGLGSAGRAGYKIVGDQPYRRFVRGKE